MDSPRFSPIKPGLIKQDALAHLRRLGDSIRGGDWRNTEALSCAFAACEVPRGEPELAEYLDALKQTVIQARASRAIAAANLSRVRAAARFQSAAAARFQSVAESRQDFADLTESRQLADPRSPLPSDT